MPKRKKKKISNVKAKPKIAPSKEKVDIVSKLEELEKKDEEGSLMVKEKRRRKQEEEPAEEEYDEEEFEEENDYIASYFEDGDDFGGGSDDNVDQATNCTVHLHLFAYNICRHFSVNEWLFYAMMININIKNILCGFGTLGHNILCSVSSNAIESMTGIIQ
ncbi:DNA-directed RNA polymerase III subunit RPC7-like [Polyodon spathula]|uniref:DNA-directed RNA polymerase III subunit RPC7-like n=1 Tax=Polyodon spathula TaxID=7913 RepID=UPI001B7DC0EA|nr:DNA-directed RNA polymerase III subunit RPC7-like [Polyodon spathula]XP_041093732.1 DNA-directed RNA polymerase III subunit RPC7-like [Polyodon spathula]